MKEYNTREIRAAARHIDAIAETVQRLKSSDVSRTSQSARTLKGDTATALADQLERLSNELTALKKGLETCSGALYAFAQQLDIADAKAKALIGSK